MNYDYDIVIVGAGPSGASLARLLNNNMRVLIVDKRNLLSSSPYKKAVCCGGLLAPDAQKALAAQGLALPQQVLVGPQMFSVKVLDFDNQLVRYYQRHYINVDREKFDRWLVAPIPERVDRKFDTQFINYQPLHKGYRVYLRTNNHSEQLTTNLLIAADGALSRVREQTFQDLPLPDKYVSMQYWFEIAHQMPHYYSIFDRSVTDFYS